MNTPRHKKDQEPAGFDARGGQREAAYWLSAGWTVGAAIVAAHRVARGLFAAALSRREAGTERLEEDENRQRRRGSSH